MLSKQFLMQLKLQRSIFICLLQKIACMGPSIGQQNQCPGGNDTELKYELKRTSLGIVKTYRGKCILSLGEANWTPAIQCFRTARRNRLLPGIQCNHRQYDFCLQPSATFLITQLLCREKVQQYQLPPYAQFALLTAVVQYSTYLITINTFLPKTNQLSQKCRQLPRFKVLELLDFRWRSRPAF